MCVRERERETERERRHRDGALSGKGNRVSYMAERLEPSTKA